MTPTETARTIIERAGAILAEPERLYLRRVMAGIAQAAGEMWEELTATFAHILQ